MSSFRVTLAGRLTHTHGSLWHECVCLFNDYTHTAVVVADTLPCNAVAQLSPVAEAAAGEKKGFKDDEKETRVK